MRRLLNLLTYAKAKQSIGLKLISTCQGSKHYAMFYKIKTTILIRIGVFIDTHFIALK
jgi:hypothetical protein